MTLTLNPAVDLYTATARVAPEHKLRCEAPEVHPGGGGINVARVLARFRHRALAVHASGGRTGERLDDLLADEGVAGRRVRTAGEARENLTVLDRQAAHQYRFVMPGSPLAPQEWQSCLSAVTEAADEGAVVVASGSVPPGVPDDVYGRLAEALSGRAVVVDAAGAPLRGALDLGVDVVSPNRRELDDLVGGALDDDGRREAAARLVAEGRARMVVVKLDVDGALVATSDAAVAVPAPAVTVRSAVGAGDSFVGALVLGLLRGLDPVDCARLAVAAGSAAVTTEGTELCRVHDVRALWGRMTGGRPFPVPS